MKKREWTFSKFVDELKSHIDRTDEYLYYQDTLTDTVGSSIKHDFVHFNWRWLNDRKKRYNWGQLTTNLLLIGQPGNISPCHYDEQHNYFCQVRDIITSFMWYFCDNNTIVNLLAIYFNFSRQIIVIDYLYIIIMTDFQHFNLCNAAYIIYCTCT